MHVVSNLSRSASLSHLEQSHQQHKTASKASPSPGEIFHRANSSPTLSPIPNQHTVSFLRLNKSTIDHKNFVDFRCLKGGNNLKMMASLEKGKLQLITGKSKGVLREIAHQVKKLAGTARTHRFQGELPLTLRDGTKVNANKLWISRQGNLVIQDANSDKHYRVDIEPEVSDVELLHRIGAESTESSEERGDEYRDVAHPAMFRLKVTLTRENTFPLDEALLQSEPWSSIVTTNPPVICMGGYNISLPLRNGEHINDIKPCGEDFQVAVSKPNGEDKRVLYTLPALRDSSPDKRFSQFTDTPPVSALEKGQTHFISRNPYEGKKLSNVGHRAVALFNFLENVAKRIHSGKQKWVKGDKLKGVGSFAKALDPGISSAYRAAKKFKTPHHNETEVNLLKQQTDTTSNKVKALLKCKTLPVPASQQQTILTEQWMRATVGRIDPRQEPANVKQLGEDLDASLKQCSTLIRYIEGATLENGGTKAEVTSHKNKADSCLTPSELWQLFDHLDSQFSVQTTLLKEFENTKQAMKGVMDRNISSSREFDVLLSHIAEQIMNVGVYLSNTTAVDAALGDVSREAGTVSPAEQKLREHRLSALSKKIAQDKASTLSRAVSLGCPDRSSYRKFLINMADLQRGRKAFEKLFDIQQGNDTPQANELAESISARGKALSRYLAETVTGLPKDSSITLASGSSASCFAGVAKFGIPFAQGFFAGVVAGVEKKYSLKLSQEKEGETIVELKRDAKREMNLIAGTGGGLEQTLLQHAKGGILTVMPFEASIVLAYSQVKGTEHKLNIKNGERNRQIEQVLDYFFDPAKVSNWEQTLDEYLAGKGEYSENAQSILEVAAEMKAEFRLQAAGTIDNKPDDPTNVGGFMYLRHTVGVTGKQSMAVVSDSNKVVGEEGCIEQSRYVNAAVKASLPLAQKFDNIFLGQSYGGPAPITQSDGAREIEVSDDIATLSYRTNAAEMKIKEIEKKIAEPNINAEDKAELEKIQERLTLLTDLKAQVEQGAKLPKIELLKVIQVIDKLILGISGKGIKVEKTVNAENLGDLYLAYQDGSEALGKDPRYTGKLQSAGWKNKLVGDKLTLDTVLKSVGKSSAKELLRSIKSSAQSQSNLENLGQSSHLKANVTYEINNERLDTMVDKFVDDMKQDLDQSQFSSVFSSAKRFGQRLERSSVDSDNKQAFRLTSIELQRTSKVKDKLASTLPFIDIVDYTQFTKEEKVGSFTFTYKEEAMIPENITLNLRADTQSTPVNYRTLQAEP